MKEKILLIGAGGHAQSVADVIDRGFNFVVAGTIEKDTDGLNDALIDDSPVLGTDDELEELFSQGYHYAIISVGSIGNTSIRRKLYTKLKKVGFSLPVIIDPSAIISDNVHIGEGTFVGKGAIVNTHSDIGNCVIINTGSIIEHGCKIGDFSHISPGATICGEAMIGNDVHIGANATVIQGAKVENQTIVGAGSVVINDLPSRCTAIGSPAKLIK